MLMPWTPAPTMTYLADSGRCDIFSSVTSDMRGHYPVTGALPTRIGGESFGKMLICRTSEVA